MSNHETTATLQPPPEPAEAEPVRCCDCGATAGVDYNVRNNQPYCFACFYAEAGGE